MSKKHPPERELVIVKDTREPDEAAGDHPDSVFRPRVFAPGIAKGTPYADRGRIEVATVRAKLDVGDYSLPGLESVVAIERKSGPDLLATLFGGAGVDALGEAKHNLDRFRAELERARDWAGFAIYCEESPAWLFREAKARFERYGKSFDPFSALSLLDSFAVDLGIQTVWCGSKGLAELRVGSTLARIWSQATGGEGARKMRKRGYSAPWLGALDGVNEPAPEVPSQLIVEPVDHASFGGEDPHAPAVKLEFAGGMTADFGDYRDRKARAKVAG